MSYKNVLLTVAAMNLGCAEKPAAKSTPVSQGPNTNICLQQQIDPSTGQPIANTNNQQTNINCQNSMQASNPNGGGFDLCSMLQSHSELASKFGIFLNALCGNGQATLSLLRSDQYKYSGTGTPQVKIDAKESAIKKDDGLARSEMQAYALFVTPATPCSYFDLMKMKIDTPDVFKTKFPAEYYDGQSVEYTKISGTVQTGVRYRYTNTSSGGSTTDAGDVDYEATATFITISPQKLYVVSTDFEQKHDMVDGMRGLSIINQGSNGITEVINISDQLFENGNNHENAIKDARGNLEEDMNYSYRQSYYKHHNLDNGQCPTN